MTARHHFLTILMSCSAAGALCVGGFAAQAADLAKPVVVAAPPTFALFDGIEYHAQVEGGILGNSANPPDGQNIGHLYTDRANTPLINQVLLTVAKNIDPKETGYALGFTLQGLFGSDERYNHFLGFADNQGGRNQAGVTQAYLALHTPWFFSGGVDIKAGLFTSPQGYETLDPSTSPFYSHSYTYNYAVTFAHTGILTTTHVNSTVDIYLGVDTGNQTTFGTNGDPNRQIAGFVGFGLNNLLDNKLTVLALSHIGPEQSLLVDPNAKNDLRYYNDMVLTYKINDDWTSVTELNYTFDTFGNAPGGVSSNGNPLRTGGAAVYSIAQYFGYALNKQVTLNVRGEVLRDDKGFFVANFPDNQGFDRSEKGNFAAVAPANISPGGTTYGGITLGLTYKPDVPKPLALIMVRPEVRYDRALSNNTPYNTVGGVGRSKDQFTFGGDVTIGF